MKAIFFILCLSLIGLFGCNSDKACQTGELRDCICTLEYDPVCGCDDITYGNACQAECSGITDYTAGTCE